MRSSTSNVSTPYEDFERAALKLALYKKLAEEAKEFEKFQEDPEFSKQMELSYNRVMGIIRRRAISDRFLRFAKYSMVKAAQIVVVMFILAEIVFVTAVASSGTVRKSVIEFLVKHTDEYTQVGFYHTGVDIDVPSDWDKPYYLSYIPEGFELVQVISVDDSGNHSTALLVDNNNNHIELHVGTTHSYAQIDSEDATISYADVHGQNATMITNDSMCRLVWRSGDSFIILSTNLSQDVLQELANGVVLIAN